jgi:hypothetical protein
MTTVRKAIEMLSDLDPDEEIAFTGWWNKSDVENNNDIELTDDEWDDICRLHEDDIMSHIDDKVAEVLEDRMRTRLGEKDA